MKRFFGLSKGCCVPAVIVYALAQILCAEVPTAFAFAASSPGVGVPSFILSKSISFTDFIGDNVVTVVVLLCVFFILIIVAVLVGFVIILRKNRRIEMESSRYKELSALTKEFIFEYDFIADKFTLNRELAAEYGLPTIREKYLRLLHAGGEGFEGESALMQTLLGSDEYQDEHCVPNAKGEKRWIRLSGKTIRDKQGKRLFSIGKVVDIQEEKQKRHTLEERAKRDGLTGLLNALETHTIIQNEIANGGGAMIVMDIDRFKMVNDTFGHIVGDKVLISFAAMLGKYFSEDILGRIGGDEFCVFLKDTDASIDDRIALQFANFQKELFGIKIDDFANRVTVSAGIAYADGKNGFEALYYRADKQMYAAKARGGNCFVSEHSENK